MLHAAIFRATCVTMELRNKLLKKLQRETEPLGINKASVFRLCFSTLLCEASRHRGKTSTHARMRETRGKLTIKFIKTSVHGLENA